VDKLKDYNISFSGLKEGKHLFEYEIGASFFELFENPLIEKGSIKAEVELNKSSALLTLDFKVKGDAVTSCDKCLDDLSIPIENEGKVYIKFGEEYDEPTEEIIVLQHGEHEINVAQLIYEFICISLPIRQVHPEDENGNLTCNPEMLMKLDEYLVEEDEDEEEIDPRWDDLNKLLGNIN